jgi:long-chain fatty acid transport protein
MRHCLSLSIACALIGAALLASSQSAFAITDLETNAAIPFSFSNPGARSLGLGGAFVGLADDATAAYTNPAGLTQLVQTEVSVEGRRVQTNSPFTSNGDATLNPFAFSGITVGNTRNTNSSPSFLSFVLPRGDWSFAFYRHELSKFNTSFFAGGTILDDYKINGITQQVTPFNAISNLHIVDYGLAVALKANDRISVGVDFSYYDFSLTSFRDQYFNNRLLQSVVDSGSDHALAATLGLRLRFNDQWSAGFAYRSSPKFGYREGAFLADSAGNLADAPAAVIDANFRVPDVISAGLSYHPSDQLVVNFDVDRVFYSKLTGNTNSIFGVSPDVLRHLTVPNGTELHLGAEYTFASMTNPMFVRAGVWHDPRHTIQFDGVPTTGDGLAEAVVFGGGYGAKIHYALGGGIVFTTSFLKGLQLDAAYDNSQKIKTASISAVYRF